MVKLHLDSSEKRESLPEFDEDLKCPSCDALTIVSYGLAGGGCGLYTSCVECGNVVSKSTEDDES
jgi:transcription elongation factor Elf1